MLPDLETDVIGAGIAIREGNPMLAAEMQAALDAMMEDGTYLEIAEEWVGGDIR
jgi:polar amino acid transport system substrate-binding protein